LPALWFLVATTPARADRRHMHQLTSQRCILIGVNGATNRLKRKKSSTTIVVEVT
jgi:hypothetical protein